MSQSQLKPGYKRATVNQNVAFLIEQGRSESEAKAIAYRHARRDLRQRLSDGVEIFRAGNYPGKIPVTSADVAAIAQTYNEHQAGRSARYEAAAKFTHESGRPAEGWVKELRAEGRSMIASFRSVSDDLCNALIDERYPNPSIELRRNFTDDDGTDRGLSLKAVAFLGADPPAVKSVAAFSEDSDGEQVCTFSFDEWSKQPTGGPDMANKEGDDNTTTVKLQVEAVAAPTNDKKTAGGTSFSEDEVSEMVKEAAEKARKDEQAKFAEQQRQSAEKSRQDSNLQFCEQLVKDKKLKPGDRDFWHGVLNALTPELNFGEGAAAKPLADELKARLGKLPESVLFAEITPKGDKGLPADSTKFTEGSDEQARFITGKAREHKLEFSVARRVDLYSRSENLSFEEAMERMGVEEGAK